jgi:uncharacterized protein YndB with AHSA1/START domain
MASTRYGTRTARAPQLRYIRTLNCAAERLWKTLTTPELLGEWIGLTVFSDTQYGGFTVTTEPGTQYTGIVTACEPLHYFQAAWDDPPHPPSTLLVDVVPGRRDSHLILTHGGITPAHLDLFQTLWTTSLERLQQYIEGVRTLRPRSTEGG